MLQEVLAAEDLKAFLDGARGTMLVAVVTVSAVVPAGEALAKLLKDRFAVDVLGEAEFGILSKPGGRGVAFCKGGAALNVDVDREGWTGEWGWMELKGFAR